MQQPRGRADPAETPARRRISRGGDAPAVDELVLGRYRLLERLGHGGFGVVWRAHDELLHREVALKRIVIGRPPIDGERATREALATARLAHPAIVALHEACPDDGAFYLISELVEGHTLAQLIAEQALEDEEILEIGLALASALEHAHERGVIHRDIKPQNVLVPEPPESGSRPPQTLLAAAKLADFGGASLVGEEALTRTGDVLGTLAYMSPEQSDGREAGASSDLYSMALVLYEALSGVNPVRGATPAATARRIGRPLAPLASARRDLPRALTAAIDRALAPAAADRGTLEELRDAFEQALDEVPTHPLARPVRRASTVHPFQPHGPSPSPAAAARSWRTLPRALWLACAVVVIGWQAFVGHAGLALLAFAALAPLIVLSGPRTASRAGAGWLVCALAPALGYVGLAGAFPALAGQAARWRERAALGALGFWWLRLAGPLAGAGRSSGTNLWLAQPASGPARSAWEGSLSLAATHVIAPLLSAGVLLGALLWACGAVALPWLVRGRSAARDAVLATVWTAGIAVATPPLDAGLGPHTSYPHPREYILGALAAALVAVAARALRGPVAKVP